MHDLDSLEKINNARVEGYRVGRLTSLEYYGSHAPRWTGNPLPEELRHYLAGVADGLHSVSQLPSACATKLEPVGDQ
jgi:hypothetical protein